MAFAFSVMMTGLAGCNIFYDVDTVRPTLPGDDAGADVALDSGADVSLDSGADVAVDTGVVDSGDDSGVVDTGTPDSGVDAAQDMTPDMPVCIPESNADFCLRYVATCGNVSRVDNCGVVRSTSCGTCGVGAFCSDNNCIETNCRNATDDDGDGMSDCADANCEAQQCDNANRRCSSGECI